MRVGVIGSGALGLYYGSLMQKDGHDVHFLLRRDYQAISRAGLKVTSPHGDFQLSQVNGYQNSQEIGPVDLVLVGLKAYANDQLAELTQPLVAAETTILTLQNGLGNEEVLAAAFGKEHVVGGGCLSLLQPRRTRHCAPPRPGLYPYCSVCHRPQRKG